MKLILLIFVLLVLLLVRFGLYFQSQQTFVDGQEIALQVTLQAQPELSVRGQSFMVKMDQNKRLYIQSNLNELYHYGDRLAIHGVLQVKELASGREVLSLYFPEINVLPKANNPLVEASRRVRERSSALFEETLPLVSSHLLLGIVFGANEVFPDDFMKHLRSTGVLHVIAASGMNVSFFTGAVMFSLGTFLKRRITLLISIFAVIFYSFLVGFEPSILRASIMALIACTASFFGRQQLAVGALFVTGYLMLLWQPSYLFEVGFQLSFLATLGILLIGRSLDHSGWLNNLGSLRNDFKTTFAAQLATLPILLGTFGTVGLLSLVVNLLVLWTVPILMLLGSLGVLVGLVVAPLGKVFLFCSLPFLLFFELVVSFFGSFGWNFVIEEFPWQLGVGYYLLLAAFVFRKPPKEAA